MLPPEAKTVALIAFAHRRELHRNATPIDNSQLHAGSPMFFTCEACFGPVIVAEGFLTRPPLCYDCRDLDDHGWLLGVPKADAGGTR